MNPTTVFGFWLSAVATLALETAIVLAAAGVAQTLIRSPRWRRAAWLAAFGGLAMVLVSSLTGVDRALAGWLTNGLGPAPRFVVRSNLPVGPDATMSDAGSTELGAAVASGGAGIEPEAAFASVPSWPAWIWLAGVMVVGFWTVLPRVWLTLAWLRGGGDTPKGSGVRVNALAARLGLRGRVRVFVSAKLTGPIAFGILRPTIGLPADFWDANTEGEQDAMLAHELAHLAARDPLGMALADALVVALWWHPLIWWGRDQLRAASEAAADEASVVVEDGPAVLARCLVVLASRWQERRGAGLLGMAGFRSGLGRRVERLLCLKPGVFRPDRCIWGGLLTSVGSAGAVAMALSIPCWLLPAKAESRPALLAMVGEALSRAVSDRAHDGGEPEAGASDTVAEAASASRSPRVQETAPAGADPSESLTGSGSRLSDPLSAHDPSGARAFSSAASLGSPSSLAGVDAGVFPGATNAMALQGSAGRAMFYSDRAGMVLVRATAKEHEAVESVLGLLNAAPPQVMLEAKFVEIRSSDSQALGLNELLGQLPAGDTTNVAKAAPLPVAFPGSTTESPLPSGTAQGGGTNEVRELRGDQLDWSGRHVTNAANIRVSAALGTRLTGVLSDAQYRSVLRALEQRAGVDVIAAPKVVTLSGRQAQIQIADMKSVVSGVNPEALRKEGGSALTNASPFTTVTVPVGPTLDLVPSVTADGSSVDLTVIPSVTEFLGYDEPPKDGKVRVWEDGKSRLVPLPLPHFRVRQMQTRVRINDGQTLVLGGLPVEETRVTRDKVPVLGDLPLTGRLFRSESRQVVKKTLLVFVTATVVDPAGNPVH